MADLKLYRAFYRSSSPTPSVGGNEWIFASSQEEARGFLLEVLKARYSEQLSRMEDETQLLDGWEFQDAPVVEGIVKMGPDIESLMVDFDLHSDREGDSL